LEVKYIQHCGDDLAVVNAARVSFKKKSEWEFVPEGPHKKDVYGRWLDEKLSDRDTKLIKYLAKHNHWSPFAHNSITLHLKMPIFLARQIDKHQVGFVVNEVSRRYVDDPPEFYWPAGWRARAENVKQGSSQEFVDLDWDVEPYVMDGVRAYDKLLESGVAPEMARMVLPQNMYTEQWKTGSLYAWFNLYSLRTKDNAQQEATTLALMTKDKIQPLFPVSWAALEEANFD
jgi:thymidylate synthase (FAD)